MEPQVKVFTHKTESLAWIRPPRTGFAHHWYRGYIEGSTGGDPMLVLKRDVVLHVTSGSVLSGRCRELWQWHLF